MVITYVLDSALMSYSQDTNTIQYELMRRIAAASGCVTIVGDPDQSSEFPIIVHRPVPYPSS